MSLSCALAVFPGLEDAPICDAHSLDAWAATHPPAQRLAVAAALLLGVGPGPWVCGPFCLEAAAMVWSVEHWTGFRHMIRHLCV